MQSFKNIEYYFQKFLANRYTKLVLLSILASIGVCLATYTYLTTTYRSSGDYKLLGGLFFCVGFFLICYLDWYLFTSKIGKCISMRKKQYLIDITIILVVNIIFVVLMGLFMKLTYNPLYYFHGEEGMKQILQNTNGFSPEQIAEEIKEAKEVYHETLGYISYKVSKGWLLIPSGFFCGFSIHVVVVAWRKHENPFMRATVLLFSIAAFVLSGYDHFLANTFSLTLGADMEFVNKVGIGKLILVVVYTLIGNALGAMFIEHASNYVDQKLPAKKCEE